MKGDTHTHNLTHTKKEPKMSKDMASSLEKYMCLRKCICFLTHGVWNQEEWHIGECTILLTFRIYFWSSQSLKMAFFPSICYCVTHLLQKHALKKMLMLHKPVTRFKWRNHKIHLVSSRKKSFLYKPPTLLPALLWLVWLFEDFILFQNSFT